MADQANKLKNRSAIQNARSSRYLLFTLLSFAFSVCATRLFLYLTGYPQIGGGELHIAHLLWGGLFLFVACLLPLIFANEWAKGWSSVISGFGIGLFIDEVGKFITTKNDYFYQSAAPIIYVFFLLVVLVFIQVRSHNRPSPRSEMYNALGELTEVLDNDFSEAERKALLTRLNRLQKQTEDQEIQQLAAVLSGYLSSGVIQIVPPRDTFVERIKIFWEKLEIKWFNRSRLRAIIIIGLILWGLIALFYPVGYWITHHNVDQLQSFIQQYLSDRLVRNASGLNWVEARVFIEGFMGIFSLLAAFLILFKKEKTGVWIGYYDLLVTLTLVNILIFYFDQFSTIFFALLQFLLLIALIRYKDRFINQKHIPMV